MKHIITERNPTRSEKKRERQRKRDKQDTLSRHAVREVQLTDLDNLER